MNLADVIILIRYEDSACLVSGKTTYLANDGCLIRLILADEIPEYREQVSSDTVVEIDLEEANRIVRKVNRSKT